MSKNRVVHFEIGAEDPEKLSAFYRKALDWEVNQHEDSGYWMAGKEGDTTPGAINGGIMKRFKSEKTVNTIETEDIDAVIAAVEANGGKVVKPKADMPYGPGVIMRWCYCEDPQGNTFGLMQIIKEVQ